MKSRSSSLVSLFVLLVGLLPGVVMAASKAPDFVEWASPTPRFHDLGLAPSEVADIVGDGQLIIVQPPRQIELWTKGKVKQYKNVRFATALVVVNAPVAKVREIVKDVGKMQEFMPQIEDSSVIAQDGKNYMAEWTQVFDLPGPLDLKADFHLQHTEEPNGDISVLLHKGDIDGGTSRWEFAEIDANRTLLAFTYWGDLDSAAFAFRVLLKSQPELIPSIPAIAAGMVTSQYKAYINDEESVSKKKMSNEGLPAKPKTPLLTSGKLKQETLERLSTFGTVLLVHPKQWIAGKKYPEDIIYVSAMTVAKGNAEKIAPIASDLSYMSDYFPSWTRKAEKEKTPQGDLVDLSMKVAIGPVGLGVNNRILLKKKNANVVLMESRGGDMDPLLGAWEFLPIQDRSLTGGEEGTLIGHTLCLEIGDDAGLLLKMVRKIPLTDLIAAMYLGMTILEKQEPWLPGKLAGEPVAAE